MNPTFAIGSRVRTSPTSYPASCRGKDGVVKGMERGLTQYPYIVLLDGEESSINYGADELMLVAPASPQTGADAQGLRDRAAALRSDADALDRAADILEQIK